MTGFSRYQPEGWQEGGVWKVQVAEVPKRRQRRRRVAIHLAPMIFAVPLLVYGPDRQVSTVDGHSGVVSRLAPSTTESHSASEAATHPLRSADNDQVSPAHWSRLMAAMDKCTAVSEGDDVELPDPFS